MKTIVVVVANPDRAGEALRAAVGLTLRGDRVAVVPPPAWPADEKIARCLGTLRALGHEVAAAPGAVDVADVVEILVVNWLVRTPAEPGPPGAQSIDALGPEAVVELMERGPVAVWATAAETLDLTGEVCPFTFVRTKLRLEELPAGARLRVVVDHEPATRNVPRSAAAWGQRVLGVGAAGAGMWEIWIEKAT